MTKEPKAMQKLTGGNAQTIETKWKEAENKLEGKTDSSWHLSLSVSLWGGNLHLVYLEGSIVLLSASLESA